MQTIRTLVVDDSALMRRMLSMALDTDDRITVVGAVESANAARKAIKDLNPDVLTLDLEMPGMDGATFLGKLMAARPMPVLVISTLAQHQSVLGVKLLELGAFDFVPKPMTGKGGDSLQNFSRDLCARVKMAAEAAPSIRAGAKSSPSRVDAPIAPVSNAPPSNLHLIGIGASTGGVPAVQALLGALPRSSPPIAIAQHMPDHFTARFAKSLTSNTALEVCEASDGMRMRTGLVAIAPGDANLVIESAGGTPVCRLAKAERSQGAAPSVDILFKSIAQSFGAKAGAAILTGMGRDGAAGLRDIHDAGGFTAAQDEASCVVFGMPRAAQSLGAAAFVGPPAKIAHALLDPTNYETRRVA